ncbi:hypothetical protein N431DRAFT_455125 [Stipitochalara longipes BDJ]|nr:hypothetical protein N431DRAFT_455125 [Stipitochalara longipes BDJ]
MSQASQAHRNLHNFEEESTAKYCLLLSQWKEQVLLFLNSFLMFQKLPLELHYACFTFLIVHRVAYRRSLDSRYGDAPSPKNGVCEPVLSRESYYGETGFISPLPPLASQIKRQSRQEAVRM